MSKNKSRPKCLGRTAGDFRGSYPCALYAMDGSEYCRYHDPKMLDAKQDARIAAWTAKENARIAKAKAEGTA